MNPHNLLHQRHSGIHQPICHFFRTNIAVITALYHNIKHSMFIISAFFTIEHNAVYARANVHCFFVFAVFSMALNMGIGPQV